jgi:hypothetical protein
MLRLFSLLFRKNPDDGQSPKTQYLYTPIYVGKSLNIGYFKFFAECFVKTTINFRTLSFVLVFI